MRGLGKLTACFPWAPCGRVCGQCPVASRLRVVAQGGRAGCLGRTGPREGPAWIYFKHRGGRASVDGSCVLVLHVSWALPCLDRPPDQPWLSHLPPGPSIPHPRPWAHVPPHLQQGPDLEQLLAGAWVPAPQGSAECWGQRGEGGGQARLRGAPWALGGRFLSFLHCLASGGMPHRLAE